MRFESRKCVEMRQKCACGVGSLKCSPDPPARFGAGKEARMEVEEIG